LKNTGDFKGDEKFVPGLKPRRQVFSLASFLRGRSLRNAPSCPVVSGAGQQFHHGLPHGVEDGLDRRLSIPVGQLRKAIGEFFDEVIARKRPGANAA